jgi:hypothetical protein
MNERHGEGEREENEKVKEIVREKVKGKERQKVES